MKKDIEKPSVQGVTIAIKLDASKAEPHWTVHLINSNDFDLENVLVASKGYGKQKGEEQLTSTLRHFFEHIGARSVQQVEVITPEVFHLFNEYWVSYYVDGKVFDKKFTFVPDSIQKGNLMFIPELNAKGVLHA
ncbi:MAG: hypothetical protein KDC58_12600 [Cyclobacteriaceae bacterium]|nr:hypothetical protein [Cyclobacteriaceae bacterium]